MILGLATEYPGSPTENGDVLSCPDDNIEKARIRSPILHIS